MPHLKPIIRKAIPEDAELIAAISRDTFYETFADQNTTEDMDKYLLEKFNINAIRSELKDPKTIFFLALVKGEVAGYAKLRENGEQEELSGVNAIEMERIYVYKTYQHQKAGAALMQESIHYAKHHSFETVWLGVWEHNTRSIEFYKRWGFEIFGKHIFRLGNDDQNDLLMKKGLNEI